MSLLLIRLEQAERIKQSFTTKNRCLCEGKDGSMATAQMINSMHDKQNIQPCLMSLNPEKINRKEK